MVGESAFQEEWDVLAHALRLSRRGWTLLIQLVGTVIAIGIVWLCFAVGSSAGTEVVPFFLIVGAGAAYLVLTVTHTLISKISDELMLTGTAPGLKDTLSFLAKNVLTIIAVTAMCYVVMLALTCLACIPVLARFGGGGGQLVYAVLLIPTFVLSLLVVLVAWTGLFVFPAIIGTDEAGFQDTVIEFLGLVRKAPLRFVARQAGVLLVAALALVPFGALFGAGWCHLGTVQMWVGQVISRGWPQSGAGGSGGLTAIAGLFEKLSVAIIVAVMITFPVVLLNNAALLMYRSTREEIEERRTPEADEQ